MKTTVELTPANAAVLSKYAALAGHTPAEFLNRYLSDNVLRSFEDPRLGDFESHLGNLELADQNRLFQ
jgi:hypothetical protein